MKNEQDFFESIKNSPIYEPREQFVEVTKQKLLREARKMEQRSRFKRIFVGSTSVVATALLLIWISLLGGKQVIFDTVTSIFNEDGKNEIIIDEPNEDFELTENGVVAKQFLEEKGYHIVSYEGSGEGYELTREKLIVMPYMRDWWLQPQGPDDYIEKIVETEFFTVENHPLDELVGVEALGKTNVAVFLVDEVAIGGTSWPVTEELVFGALYSLDGLNLEELHGVDYSTWQDAWLEKYGEEGTNVDDDEPIADDTTEPVDTETALLAKTEAVFSYLQNLNWPELAQLVHPDKGLFFSFYADAGSPYSHEVAFTKAELSNLTGNEVYIWGYDMGGYAFEFSVDEYVSKFIVQHSMRWDGENSKPIDYSVITFNDSVVESGGIINTIAEYFPDAKYVEYYSPVPSEDLWYEWQALRFIYEEHEGEWYLIGIARDVHSP